MKNNLQDVSSLDSFRLDPKRKCTEKTKQELVDVLSTKQLIVSVPNSINSWTIDWVRYVVWWINWKAWFIPVSYLDTPEGRSIETSVVVKKWKEDEVLSMCIFNSANFDIDYNGMVANRDSNWNAKIWDWGIIWDRKKHKIG